MAQAVFQFYIHRSVFGGIFHPAHVFVRHEILGKCLFFLRFQPGEIRLVIREDAGHQLDVRTVLVRQIPVPGLAEITVSPGPLFFSGGNVVVRHVEKTCVQVFVKVPDEVVVRMCCHVRGGHFDVAVAGNVDALRIIVFIVFACGNGEGGYGPFAVIHDCMHVRREYGICMLIDRNCRIGPPQEGLRHIGAVVKLPLDLDIGFAGIQGKCAHALGAVHFVDFTDIDCGRTVLVLLIEIICRRIGRRPVVLGPVELNASRDPRPGQTYQRRLDHMIVIDKIIAVGLVVCPLDPAADLGKDHHLQIFVFQVNCVVSHVLFLIGYFFCDRKGIDSSAAPLVSAVFQEKRAFLRCRCWIGRDDHLLFPHLYACCCHNNVSFHFSFTFDRCVLYFLPLE